jgi:hypothetical protein
MPLFFDIDSKQRFSIEVMIGNELYTQSLSEVIARVTADSKRIKQLYTDFALKEGRIHGQGRVQIVEGLDELFGVLLFLRKSLIERAPREIASVNTVFHRVMIVIKMNKFVVKGTLDNRDLSNLVSFNTGYNVLILKEIKNLLIKCKNTLNSEELLLEKYKDLYNTFDEIFYNTILLRYAIENLLIDN